MPNFELDPGRLEEIIGRTLLAMDSSVAGLGRAATEIESTRVDIQTRGDLAARDALVKAVSGLQEELGLGFVVYSEELESPVKLSENPRASVVADEWDGTHNKLNGAGILPNGPLVGIAYAPNPKFEDVVAAGFLEVVSGNLFVAVRGNGAYVISHYLRGGRERETLRTSGKKVFDGNEQAIIDTIMLGNLQGAFPDYTMKLGGGQFNSTAAHLALVAAGGRDIFVTGDNCTSAPNKRRTGEEIGPLYLLLNEAGGTILDWNGNDLGQELIGLGEKKVFHVVAAATPELGREFVREAIHKNPVLVSYMKGKGIYNPSSALLQ